MPDDPSGPPVGQEAAPHPYWALAASYALVFLAASLAVDWIWASVAGDEFDLAGTAVKDALVAACFGLTMGWLHPRLARKE